MHDKAMNTLIYILLFAALGFITIGVYACDNDNSMTDCSRREKPMRKDPVTGDWHCRD